MMRKIKKYLRLLAMLPITLDRLRRAHERTGLNVGLILAASSARQAGAADQTGLKPHEFRVFSQGGEDGIIQYLVSVLPISERYFVEFGVQDYTESNTRFLLMKDSWRGLVLDGSVKHIRSIRDDVISARHSLQSICTFITVENINATLSQYVDKKRIGILSIDIDGNDYWIWKQITAIDADIVIVEYNHRFGPTKSVTVPYKHNFVRGQHGLPYVYYGASLAALWKLALEKGYALVGCNSYGNNAFFVRRDILPVTMPSLRPEEAFSAASFRELRDAKGDFACSVPAREAEAFADLPLVEV